MLKTFDCFYVTALYLTSIVQWKDLAVYDNRPQLPFTLQGKEREVKTVSKKSSATHWNAAVGVPYKPWWRVVYLCVRAPPYRLSSRHVAWRRECVFMWTCVCARSGLSVGAPQTGFNKASSHWLALIRMANIPGEHTESTPPSPQQPVGGLPRYQNKCS